jgi:hypothetical protein
MPAAPLMGSKPIPDNIKQGLNIRPAYLLCRSAGGHANQIIARSPSRARTTRRLPTASPTWPRWSPSPARRVLDDRMVSRRQSGATDTIEVDYLNGVETPTLESATAGTSMASK